MSNEAVVNIPIAKLKTFPGHPYKVTDDEEMLGLAENIRHAGVLTPILVRKVGKDSWQIISGHRRTHACKLCGRTEIPAIEMDVDDDQATVMMVDSNFQREKILPSEKARSYRMKYEAIKHQGKRRDITSDHDEQKLLGMSARDKLAETSPDSSVTICRYLRLNELIPELLELVDLGTVAVTPAVELSYLPEHAQRYVVRLIDEEQISPSRSQGMQLHTYAKDRMLTEEVIRNVLLEEKKPDRWRLALSINKVSKYFPTSYSPEQMEATILRLLESWYKQQTNKQSMRRKQSR